MASKRDRPYRQIRAFDTVFASDSAEDSVSSPTEGVQKTSLKSIRLPASQPRRYFDPQKMQQLTLSIKEHGILEPLLVRPLANGEYELVAGERRYRAAIEAQLEDVPITVRTLTDKEAFQLALVENLQREDLNPVEETEGILQLLAIDLNTEVSEITALLYRMENEAKGKVTPNVTGNEEGQRIQTVFEGLGLMSWESFVRNRLPLLNLPEEILEALRSGKIAYTKAQAIARIKDSDQRQQLLEDAIAGDWSLSQIKERIAALRSTPKESEESDTSTLFESAKLITSFLKKKRTLEPQKQKRAEELMAELRSLFSGE